MKSVYVTFLLLLISASLIVVSQRGSQTASPEPSWANPDSMFTIDEANDEALKAWDVYVTKCEESYYLRPCCDGKGPICEYRFVSISNEEKPLDEPDKLNCIERKLVSSFVAKAERCHRNSGWEEWHATGRMPMDLTKKSGKWIAGKPQYAGTWEMSNTKISCAEVPK